MVGGNIRNPPGRGGKGRGNGRFLIFFRVYADATLYYAAAPLPTLDGSAPTEQQAIGNGRRNEGGYAGGKGGGYWRIVPWLNVNGVRNTLYRSHPRCWDMI